MSQLTEKIRQLVGDGDLEEALDALDDFLETRNDDELRDEVILLKSRFKSLERDRNQGVGFSPNERNQIVAAVLDLTKKIDKNAVQKERNSIQKETTPLVAPTQNFGNQPPPPNGFTARVFIDGDLSEFYLTTQNAIVRLDPISRQSFVVANKFPSNDVRFAWTYFVPSMNFWASVDFQGVIWTMNFYGQILRIGQVQYLQN